MSPRIADAPEVRIVTDRLQELKAKEFNLKAEICRNEETMRSREGPLQDDELSVRLRQQRAERVTLQREIAQQEQALSCVRSEASRAICETVRRQHEQALRGAALSIVGACRLALAAAEIRKELERGDVSTATLPHVVFPGLEPEAMEQWSVMSYFSRECLRAGLLTRDDVPELWLQRWRV